MNCQLVFIKESSEKRSDMQIGSIGVQNGVAEFHNKSVSHTLRNVRLLRIKKHSGKQIILVGRMSGERSFWFVEPI
jgi:hypothetical protein